MQNKSGQKPTDGTSTNHTKKTFQDDQKRVPLKNYESHQNNKTTNRKAYRYKGYSGNIKENKDSKTFCPPPKNGQKASDTEKSNILEKFLPESLYNPESKKLFGLITAEDLLLIALIFILLDSDREDSGLLCLAILYLLISDHLNFSEFLSI